MFVFILILLAAISNLSVAKEVEGEHLKEEASCGI